MSNQTVLNFMRKAQEDKTLYEKVNALSSRNLSELIQVAHTAGFDFTADEFVSTISKELTDDDLNQVAGGAIYMRPSNSSQVMPTDQLSLNFTKFITDGS